MTAKRVRALMEGRRSGWVARGLVGPTSDELRSLARDAGWRFVEVKLAGVSDKQGLMRTLARSFELPAYFGGNWDAFDECLGDEMARCDGMVLRLKGLGGLPDGLADPLVEIVNDYVESDVRSAGDAGPADGAGAAAVDAGGSGAAATAPGSSPIIVVADPPLPEIGHA